MMSTTKIADWEDGTDKLAYSTDNGSTYLSNPFGSGTISSNTQVMGLSTYTMVFGTDPVRRETP